MLHQVYDTLLINRSNFHCCDHFSVSVDVYFVRVVEGGGDEAYR